MHGNLPAQAQRAIFPEAISDCESSPDKFEVRNDSDSLGWFAKLARKLWPSKSAAAIELYTHAPTSTCLRWCRGGSDITGSALRDLIRSEDGLRVVNELVAGSKAKWVRDLKRGQLALAQLDQWKQFDLGVE